MGVVRREGKWTLEKDREGLYAICRRGQKQAEIVTDDYRERGGMVDLSIDPTMETIEVSDFKAAEGAFHEYIESQESGRSLGGFGLGL